MLQGNAAEPPGILAASQARRRAGREARNPERTADGRPVTAGESQDLMNDAPPTTKTVLIAEDNMDNRIIYATMLSHVGYRVVEADNGVEAVRVARTERPDIILMDISMPLMDGYEATRVLKADPQTRGIPIVAVTAHAMVTDRDAAKEAGCDDYVSKPVEPQGIRSVVERWIGAAR